MAHEKLKAAALFLVILAIVGGVCWLVMTVSLARAHSHVGQLKASLMTQSAAVCFRTIGGEEGGSGSALAGFG
jgi:hypothetical protein